MPTITTPYPSTHCDRTLKRRSASSRDMRGRVSLRTLLALLVVAIAVVLWDPWPRPTADTVHAIAPGAARPATPTTFIGSAALASPTLPTPAITPPATPEATASQHSQTPPAMMEPGAPTGLRSALEEIAPDVLNPHKAWPNGTPPQATPPAAAAATAAGASAAPPRQGRKKAPAAEPGGPAPSVAPAGPVANAPMHPPPAVIPRFGFPIVGAWHQADKRFAIVHHSSGTVLAAVGDVIEAQWQVAAIATHQVEVVHMPTQTRQIVSLNASMPLR